MAFDPGGRLFTNAAMYLRIADNAALADLLAPGLELRLDQRHDLCGPRREGRHHGEDMPQRDERDVDADARDGAHCRKVARLQVSRVGVFDDRDPRIAAQLPVQLAVADVERDHVGGAATLLRRLPVGMVLDGGFVHTSEAYAATITTARARGVPWRIVRAGDSLDIDGVRLMILAPDAARAASATDANEASVIVAAEYRGVRVLLTGDAEREEEERVRRQYPARLQADILKVGHHGSSTSSSPAFLDAVRPRVALVSVGAGNTYGHPSDAVLESLVRRGAQVMRTDDEGTIVVSTDGTSLRVATSEGRWVLRAGSARQ